jgi:nitrite reductase/ring-hydroxylating ferredoxin subunit
MALRVKVCRTDDVAPGQMRGFVVEGVAVPILVANVGGELRAASGMCPHEDVLLLGGTLAGGAVTCPGHAYEFDLATGRCSHDAALVLPCYRVTIVGDDVYVDLV